MTNQKEEPSDSLFDALTSSREQVRELTLFFEIETDALEGLEDLVRDQVSLSNSEQSLNQYIRKINE